MSNPLKAKITFISAGAGSGKTHRLTELLAEELGRGGVRPAGVIVTTYTRKAAAELRERARVHLLAQGQFSLAQAMGQARIGTVNSVCGQLVARFAFEAGLSVEQQVLEKEQSGRWLDKAADAVLAGPEMDDLLRLVTRLGLDIKPQTGDKSAWKAALNDLVDQIRSNDIALDRLEGLAHANAETLLGHFPKPSAEDLTASLLAAIDEALPEIEAVALAGNKKNTHAYLEQLKGFARDLKRGAAPWGAWAKLSKSEAGASLRSTIEPITELASRSAEHPDLHTDLRKYLSLMFGLAGRAIAHYQAMKQEAGLLDFVDQEHQLLKLLDHPEVAAVLDEALDLLMVDEFQDTSPIQLALFLKLARFAKRVYWVGDIKQAIYGFRGSDTALMQAMIGALPALGGSKAVLPNSWRSRPALVRLVNAVFVPAFADTLTQEEVALAPVREDGLPGPALANWLLGGKNIDQEGVALAAGVRKLIDSAYLIHDKSGRHARPVRFGDIAILAATNDRVDAWVAALSAQGIPVATAQAGLLATPEVTLAMACLRRLNDPRDTVASAEIVSLADGTPPEDWVADRLRYVASGAPRERWLEVSTEAHPAHPVLAKIAELRASRPLLTPREALVTLIAECALPQKVASWQTLAGSTPDRVRMRLANLEALLALAAQYEDLCRSAEQAASVSGLVLWLVELADQGQDRLAEPAIDAVKVMTNYAAKGLEWPVVVLTDLARSIKDRLWAISAHTTQAFDAHQPLAERFIRYWPWPYGQQQKVQVADDIAQTATAAACWADAIEEEKRLLYVSMTRARDLLVLARSSRKPTGEWIDAVDAPWLLPGEGSDVVSLPNGEQLPAERWMLYPEAATSANADDKPDDKPQAHAAHWFDAHKGHHNRLPLFLNPSAVSGGKASVLAEDCRIGTRIPVAAGTDMAALGTAIHACLALSFTDPAIALTEIEAQRVLDGFGVGDSVSASGVLQQVKAFHSWVNHHWPDAPAYAEIPVQQQIGNGQILNGRIDLLLETPEGWILIDHKSSPLTPARWPELAAEHGPQLQCYAHALQQVTGKPVQQIWLFLPVAGGAIRLSQVAPG